MLLGVCYCHWKCLNERHLDISICQNSELSKANIIDIPNHKIIKRYIENTITNAIVIAGLEPFLQFQEIYDFVQELRNYTQDDVVIYTGYYKNEIKEYVEKLKQYKNIIIKFGRFIPNSNKKYDDVLGIWLVSDNQYAIKIS